MKGETKFKVTQFSLSNSFQHAHIGKLMVVVNQIK